jgi:hypothetical protein
MYATILKFEDGNLVNLLDFAQNYGMFFKGFSLKVMKVPRQNSLEEGSNIFRLIINKNNNNYTFQKTKNMFTHSQKTQST